MDDIHMSVESSDSDSSDGSENNQEDALLEKARQLELDIGDNKYLYNSHIELVEIYKKIADLTSLREAYQRFHEYFPLTSELWMDWINAEKSVATTKDDQEFIFGLFQKAVNDYLSVELWIEYAQFAIGASTLEKTRSILEEAVNAAGLVCNKGVLLWDTYREIEFLHITSHSEGSEEWKKQVLTLADIYKRELSVPLLGMENTYAEWKTWIASLPNGVVDSKLVEYGYNNAKKTLEVYKPFEDQLLVAQSNEELLNTYREYIKHVTDPSTIICVYERAAAQLCLVPDIWHDYCSYVFKLTESILSVCKRALRNCPWSEELWAFKIRVLEHLQKKESTVMECFEEGLSSIAPNPGLELWLTYLEYANRNVQSSKTIYKLFNQAIEQLGFENDPQFKVARLFSRILYEKGDKEDGRKLWKKVLYKPPNRATSIFWLEYVNLEKQYGDPQSVRQVLQRALNAVSDWPQNIIDEWLLFERHRGSLDDVMKCIQKVSEFNQKYQTQVTSETQPQPKSSNYTPDVQNRGTKRKIEQPRQTLTKRAKNEPEKLQSNSNRPAVDKNPETTVFVSNLLPAVTEQQLEAIFPNAVTLEIARDKKGKSRCFGYVQFKTQEEVMVALARDREPLDGRPVFISEIKTDKTEKKPVFKYAAKEEKNKLFVRGLPVTKSKEEVAEIFSKYGVADVRLVLHKSGQPKGLAYVEFESENQANQALKETDQMTIDGHVITVVISAPPPKKDKPSKPSFSRNKVDEEEPLRHARSRLQTSLLPRSLQVKQPEQSKNGGGGDQKMKSNSDFRAMLLKK